MRSHALLLLAAGLLAAAPLSAVTQPMRARSGMVVSESAIASNVGARVLDDGGTAVDAAVATAFALAVAFPSAGNIGGGGFLLHRSAAGEAETFDFREMAPAAASATMFLRNGTYDPELHHNSHLAVGVPGTVAGLHRAWKNHGRLPWARLVEPAIALARDGFVLTDNFVRNLDFSLPRMRNYPASVAQFTRNGVPYQPGDLFRQPDLARTLGRIAAEGPAGFYEGTTAELIEKEMKRGGGIIDRSDLRAYQPKRRTPVRGTYRGYEVLSVPPPSSGGVALVEMLNTLEGYDLASRGFASAAAVHLLAEASRRAYADRARFLGDPDFVPAMPIERLISKDYAADLRRSIREDRASRSAPDRFDWPAESAQTTQVSVVDRDRNAVSLTYTLEDDFGSKIVVPGAGFLLNNEMGDFNAGPGLTSTEGLIGTDPNLAAPGKRMLSSMTPTIVSKDGKLFMAIGTPGSRYIINTVLQVIVNVVDFGMNIQEAIDAPRVHHQWLPDEIAYETHGLSADTVALLRSRGHTVKEGWPGDTIPQGIVVSPEGVLEGGSDRRSPDGAAVGSAAAQAPRSRKAASSPSASSSVDK